MYPQDYERLRRLGYDVRGAGNRWTIIAGKPNDVRGFFQSEEAAWRMCYIIEDTKSNDHRRV